MEKNIQEMSAEELLKEFKSLYTVWDFRYIDNKCYDKRFRTKERIDVIEAEMIKRMNR